MPLHKDEPGSDDSRRIAFLALDRLTERRARMDALFERIQGPMGLRHGDLDAVRRLGNPRFLIITADDFGFDEDVNQAVENGVVAGILTAASLMVGAPGASDAVSRARRLTQLRVGLHLVLADGAAILPHDRLPQITNSAGRLGDDLFYKSVKVFARPAVRAQFEAEIRAQFQAFVDTGLVLDHVNVHKHFHLHPTLLEMILRVGREFGAPAIRVPREPLWCAINVGTWSSVATAIMLKPWVALMKRRVRAAGLFHNDTVFGLANSGRVDETTLSTMIQRLPPGVSEIYLHPAMMRDRAISRSSREYWHFDELEALLSPKVRSAVTGMNIETGGFADAARRYGS